MGIWNQGKLVFTNYIFKPIYMEEPFDLQSTKT